MSSKIDVNEGNNKDLIQRIVTRMMGQGESEIIHTMSKLFPNSKIMRLKAMAVDFAQKRENSAGEFVNLFDMEQVNMDVFNSLSGAGKSDLMFGSRASYDATKFNLQLTCNRTPFKEFFDECKDRVCDECITTRITSFVTDNQISITPFEVKIEKVEQRRIDICKGCGNLLDPRKDQINMQNERMLYTCSYCGHKGWAKAK